MFHALDDGRLAAVVQVTVYKHDRLARKGDNPRLQPLTPDPSGEASPLRRPRSEARRLKESSSCACKTEARSGTRGKRRRICPDTKTSVAPTVAPDHDMTWGKPIFTRKRS